VSHSNDTAVSISVLLAIEMPKKIKSTL